MSALLLAMHLTLTNGVVTVRCETPASPGSYSVQVSSDLHEWRVVQSGYVEGATHVVVRRRCEGQCFFRVEWR